MTLLLIVGGAYFCFIGVMAGIGGRDD